MLNYVNKCKQRQGKNHIQLPNLALPQMSRSLSQNRQTSILVCLNQKMQTSMFLLYILLVLNTTYTSPLTFTMFLTFAHALYYFNSVTGPKQEEQIHTSHSSVWGNKQTFAEVRISRWRAWNGRGGSTKQIGTWTFVASLLKKKSLDRYCSSIIPLSYHYFATRPPKHAHVFVPFRHELKNSVAAETGLLHSRTTTNGHFHFLVIVE
jgi:hypothetical protein